MIGADDSSEVGRRAEELYAARAAMAQVERRPAGIGVAELVRFLDDPQRFLSMEEQRALFSNPRLRADFQRLKARRQLAELPAQAAASTDVAEMRRFDGGTVRIHPSRVPGQVYVLFQFVRQLGTPSAILLEGAAGDLVKRPLPAPDATGQVVLVLNQGQATDQDFLRLIADPSTTGAFLL
jgi:hypothetical protein